MKNAQERTEYIMNTLKWVVNSSFQQSQTYSIRYWRQEKSQQNGNRAPSSFCTKKKPKGQHQQLQTNELAIKPIQTVHVDHNEENIEDTRREQISRTGRL